MFANEHNHTPATLINNPGRKNKKHESEESNGSNSTDEACERVRIPARAQKYAPTLRILSRAMRRIRVLKVLMIIVKKTTMA